MHAKLNPSKPSNVQDKPESLLLYIDINLNNNNNNNKNNNNNDNKLIYKSINDTLIKSVLQYPFRTKLMIQMMIMILMMKIIKHMWMN